MNKSWCTIYGGWVGGYLLAAFSTAASALLGRPLRPDLTGVTVLVTNQTELKYSKT